MVPIYAYEDPATGETLEEFRPISERDRPPAPGYRRVPALPAPHDLERRSEDRISIRTQMARGLKKAEGHPSLRDICPAAAKAAFGLN